VIGLVAVSHSRALAEAAVHLALQMGGDDPPRVRIAAGGPDDDLGTDAVAIAAAIDEAESGDGVLVLMDLGSAILSAETALEFVAQPEGVRLSPAPFVEGLVAAVVTATGGGDLETVARECATAADAKARHLDAGVGGPASGAPSDAGDRDEAERSFEAVVTAPSGLHARPAAALVKAASRHDAEVRIADLETGTDEVSGRSLLAVMALGIRQGSRVRVSASGPEAEAAIDELRALFADGFGEG
jgi:dihydroxyacetone kinase phosphotransfer subunit